ncbi:hypothetical protein Hanom_Chr13g01238821 [Helianthus anomalus]
MNFSLLLFFLVLKEITHLSESVTYLIGPNYLHSWCVDRHPKKVFFVLTCTHLQCRIVAKTRRFGPVNQIKTDGCLMGLLTGLNTELWPRFGSVTQTRQSFVWLTGPKRGQSSAFWSGQQTRQTPVSLCLVNRTKTSRFGHSSTLQSVHIRTKKKHIFGV